MELELGLKITKTRDDLTSTTKFRMAKDSSGPIFMSRETESKFILTAHLKGFGREHIRIKINEDGTQLAITSEKPVQEMVMSRWMMHKKEVELKGFIRVFGIPDGVVLDRIKANFNEQESVLTILMPKSVKGIRGVGIEQVKEEEEEEVVDTGRNDEIGSTNEVTKSVGKVEESGQILQKKKGDKEKSQAKEKEIVNGDKVKEQKIKTRYENRRARGESSKKGASNKGEEEAKDIANKEEFDSIDKERVDGEKLKRTQEVNDKPPQEKKVSTAQKKEVDQTTKQTYNMEASIKPQRKDAEMKEQIKSPEIREEDNNAFRTLERSDTKEGIREVEGEVLEELEAIARSRKLQHCQPEKEKHHEYEEVHDREEKSEKEDEVQEEEPQEDPDKEKEENERKEAEMKEQIKSQEIQKEDNNAFRMLERSDTEEGIREVEGEVLKELEAIAQSRKLQHCQPEKEKHHEYEEAYDREENPEKEDEDELERKNRELEEMLEWSRKSLPDHPEEEDEVQEEEPKVSQGNKNPTSRKIRLCTPCVIAGSAIIASLVVFAIHWIRSKKKEVH